jgi:hypothetical protein
VPCSTHKLSIVTDISNWKHLDIQISVNQGQGHPCGSLDRHVGSGPISDTSPTCTTRASEHRRRERCSAGVGLSGRIHGRRSSCGRRDRAVAAEGIAADRQVLADQHGQCAATSRVRVGWPSRTAPLGGRDRLDIAAEVHLARISPVLTCRVGTMTRCPDREWPLQHRARPTALHQRRHHQDRSRTSSKSSTSPTWVQAVCWRTRPESSVPTAQAQSD